jgi:hypothetical protein
MLSVPLVADSGRSDGGPPPVAGVPSTALDDEVDEDEDGGAAMRTSCGTSSAGQPRVLLGRRDDALLFGAAAALGASLGPVFQAAGIALPRHLVLCLGLDPGAVTSHEVRNDLLPALEAAVAAALGTGDTQ